MGGARSPSLLILALLLATATSGCVLAKLGVPDRHAVHALESNQVLVGAWLGSWPADSNPVIADFEGKIGARLDLVDTYMDWQTPIANVTHTLEHITARGTIPVLTWEPMGITTPQIVDGTLHWPMRDGTKPTIDDYLASFSAGVCTVAQRSQEPVIVRMLHEMNGGWFSWGLSYTDKAGHHPNSPESYKAAWVKVHDAFTSRCGDSVRFVWAINHFSKGAGVDFTGSYPGDAYVDFLGIDGYNWGTSARWGWQTFDELFRPGYCAITGLSGKPVLIDEVASSERGGDKAAWIADMFQRIDQYDRVRGFVWFSDAKYEVEIHGPMDWNVDSSPQALAAFAAGAQHLVDRRAGAAPPAASTPVAC